MRQIVLCNLAKHNCGFAKLAGKKMANSVEPTEKQQLFNDFLYPLIN
jgi:hypothetical protein